MITNPIVPQISHKNWQHNSNSTTLQVSNHHHQINLYNLLSKPQSHHKIPPKTSSLCHQLCAIGPRKQTDFHYKTDLWEINITIGCPRLPGMCATEQLLQPIEPSATCEQISEQVSVSQRAVNRLWLPKTPLIQLDRFRRILTSASPNLHNSRPTSQTTSEDTSEKYPS